MVFVESFRVFFNLYLRECCTDLSPSHVVNFTSARSTWRGEGVEPVILQPGDILQAKFQKQYRTSQQIIHGVKHFETIKWSLRGRRVYRVKDNNHISGNHLLQQGNLIVERWLEWPTRGCIA